MYTNRLDDAYDLQPVRFISIDDMVEAAEALKGASKRNSCGKLRKLAESLVLVASDRELCSLILDFRIAYNIKDLPDELRKRAYTALKVELAKHMQQNDTYDHEAEEKLRDARREKRKADMEPIALTTTSSQEEETNMEDMLNDFSDLDSDDDDDDSDADDSVCHSDTEIHPIVQSHEVYITKAKKIIRNWLRLVAGHTREDLVKHVYNQNTFIDTASEIQALDPVAFYEHIRSKNSSLLIICQMAERMLGQPVASSYVERVNSAAKFRYGTDNVSLSPECLDKMVMLRMNKTFLALLRKKFHSMLKHQWQRRCAVRAFDRQLRETAAKTKGKTSSAIHISGVSTSSTSTSSTSTSSSSSSSSSSTNTSNIKSLQPLIKESLKKRPASNYRDDDDEDDMDEDDMDDDDEVQEQNRKSAKRQKTKRNRN